MRLSALTIKNYNNINSFDFANQWTIRAGEPNTLYFQLVDLDKDKLRYIPIGATPGVSVKFPNIDSDDVITVSATQVNVLDGSLWSIALTADQVPSSGNVVFSLTEGGVTRSFSVMNGMAVEYPGNDGSC